MYESMLCTVLLAREFLAAQVTLIRLNRQVNRIDVSPQIELRRESLHAGFIVAHENSSVTGPHPHLLIATSIDIVGICSEIW